MTKARSNATANAAKGDLTVGNGTNLSGVLGVGSNGDTIVADSSTSTGLRYTAGNAQGNPVINSAMQIWQRGTSITTGGGYTADRWACAGNTAATVTRQTTSDSTNLPFIQYCARVQRNSGSAVTNNINFVQNFETINSIPFAGKTVTFSFYARRGANYSSASNVLRALIVTGTGTDESAYLGYTGAASPIDQNATLTTTWQRFSYTGTIATNVTELAPYFLYTPTGTAGAADFFEVTGVQLDVGSVALPFRTYAGTIQGELAACQRYYIKFDNGANYGALCTGAYYTTTDCYADLQLPVAMRIQPSITAATDALTAQVAGNVRATTAAPTVQNATVNNTRVMLKVVTGADTAGRAVNVLTTISRSLELSAEL
jgi:hypothetical protein